MLDSLRADVVFGWRLLWKSKATSTAAVVSLGLAIGSCVAAFRIIDALLWRPLPIREPARLHALYRNGIGPDGRPRSSSSFEYPLFAQMRDAAAPMADLVAVSYATRRDLTYSTDEETEKAYVQWVSGTMFDRFGVAPALGRVLTANDDLKPGANPVAAISYDYWTRRFGSDPGVVGRKLRMGAIQYEVVGVAGRAFTGTEPGTITDVFLPAMMNEAVTQSNSSWLRTFALLKPGVAGSAVRDAVSPVFQAFQQEMARGIKSWPKERLEQFLRNYLTVEPAATGVSNLQESYRVALTALGVLVSLILLIACANLANLLMAQGTARAREMALRVAIGAGRGRLLQLVLVESALVAIAGAALGGVFAWRAAPVVVGMINPPDHPVRLVLSADARVLGFAALAAVAATMLFGLGPALRASATRPAEAMRQGRGSSSRRRAMHALVAAQAAFCFLVLFDARLFTATFERLSKQPTGFTAEGVVNVVTSALPAKTVTEWQQAAEQLRSVPGVESVAVAGFPLLSGSMEGGFVSVNGGPPGQALVSFVPVSPTWFETMRIPMVGGGGFDERDQWPGVAVVNETFAKLYFHGEDPVGKSFDTNKNGGAHVRIAGVARDARYSEMRGPIPPVVYLPFRSVDAEGRPRKLRDASFVVRVAGGSAAAEGPMLRRAVSRAGAGFLVSRVVPETELVEQQTIRERLLATLASFFAGTALLLAAIGLYGVLQYSVAQQRRELGIRIAVGAPAREVVRRATANGLGMMAVGAAAGLGLARISGRFIESLVYGVKATDLATVGWPAAVLLVAAVAACVPAAVAALRIDAAEMLRAE
jgi:predicted permease